MYSLNVLTYLSKERVGVHKQAMRLQLTLMNLIFLLTGPTVKQGVCISM